MSSKLSSRQWWAILNRKPSCDPARPSDPRRIVPEEIENALRDYRPVRRWEYQPITPGQQGFLASLGAEYTRDLTKGEASYLIDTLLDAEPSWRQKDKLIRRGQWREGMTRREASKLCAEPGDCVNGW